MQQESTTTLMELSMYPIDKGESLSVYVAKLVDVIDQSGLPYKLGPMGTVIEGTWDEVIHLLTQCQKTLEPHSNRIIANAKFDTRKNSQNRLTEKVHSVQNKMRRPQVQQ